MRRTSANLSRRDRYRLRLISRVDAQSDVRLRRTCVTSKTTACARHHPRATEKFLTVGSRSPARTPHALLLPHVANSAPICAEGRNGRPWRHPTAVVERPIRKCRDRLKLEGRPHRHRRRLGEAYVVKARRFDDAKRVGGSAVFMEPTTRAPCRPSISAGSSFRPRPGQRRSINLYIRYRTRRLTKGTRMESVPAWSAATRASDAAPSRPTIGRLG